MNKQSKLFIFSEKLSEVDKKAASKSSFGTVYFASNTFSKVRRDRAKSLLTSSPFSGEQKKCC